MPRKKHNTPGEEFDYRLHQFIKGPKYGALEAKIRFVALILFAHRNGIRLPAGIGIDGIELASTQSLEATPASEQLPPATKNVMEELQGRA